MYFISRNELVFFEMFFYPPKLTVFSLKSATIQCARWAEKTHVFVVNALPKSNARAHLKQRKKHSGLNGLWYSYKRRDKRYYLI